MNSRTNAKTIQITEFQEIVKGKLRVGIKVPTLIIPSPLKILKHPYIVDGFI